MADETKSLADKSSFEERFKIDFSTPLPDFDTGGGSAYMVVDSNDIAVSLYALVQSPNVPIRNGLYSSLVSRPIKGLVNPVARGLAHVDDNGKSAQRLVTVFQRPTGGRVITENGTHHSINVGQLRTTVLASITYIIAQLHDRDFLHRGLLPSRLFMENENTDEVVIGECVSEPAGYLRVFAQEPLELAIADQSSRGDGTPAADIFHIGVTILSAFVGRDLTVQEDTDPMLQLTARINQGSYSFLTAGTSVPGALGKAIQGMLTDEEGERWTIIELVDWMDGSTAHRRSGLVNRSLSRPVTFERESIADRRLLAEAFCNKPEAAIRFIRDKDFLNWLRVAVRDEVLDDRIEGILGFGEAAQTGSGTNWDQTQLARVCMLLHPDGPIRFGGLKLMGDGFQGAIVNAYIGDNRSAISVLKEASKTSLLTSLADIAGQRNLAITKGMSSLSEVHSAFNNPDLGFGPEHVLYLMNPQLPCVSARFDRYWVGSLKQMLKNLDKIAQKDSLSNVMMDRHIAAFCVVHGPDLAADFRKMASFQGNSDKFNMQMTKFLGIMQTRLNVERLPNLTAALVKALRPALKKLKNRKRRDDVADLLERVQKSGQISKLVNEVDLAKIQQLDAREFSAAVRRMSQLDRAKYRLTQPISAADPESIAMGLKGGATISALAAVVSVIAALI